MTPRPGSWQYLKMMGVCDVAASTFAFDPGYSPKSLDFHIDQSGHLLCGIKLSMGTWQLGSKKSVKAKVKSIRKAGLEAVAGGASFEVAAFFGAVPEYFAHCASTGFQCVEVGEGFAARIANPKEVASLAREHGLVLKYELGRKFEGAFSSRQSLCEDVRRWLEAGAEQIVVEAREDALDVGVFDSRGALNRELADHLLNCVEGDFRRLQFEAPTKMSQFSLIEHFGREVILGNVRLEEILRVEVFRRGLHPRSFLVDKLRPTGPSK